MIGLEQKASAVSDEVIQHRRWLHENPHVDAILQQASIPCSPVMDVPQVLSDPHIRDHRNMFPSIHLNACGGFAPVHSDEFYVADVERACVNSAKAQVLTVQSLLENNAETGYEVIRDFAPHAVPMQEYLQKKAKRFTKYNMEMNRDDTKITAELK